MKPVFDPDEIFEFASVYTTYYDIAADSTVSSSIEAESQDISRYDPDARFVSCLNKKLRELNFGATIGSTISSYDYYYLFLGQNPLTLTSEEIGKYLSSTLDYSQINAVIKAVEASKSKGTDAKDCRNYE